MTENKVSYIDFSIDFNGECECVDDLVINDESVTIDDEDVNPFIEKLQEVEGFLRIRTPNPSSYLVE